MPEGRGSHRCCRQKKRPPLPLPLEEDAVAATAVIIHQWEEPRSRAETVRKGFCVRARAWTGLNQTLQSSAQGLTGSIKPDTINWFNSRSNWSQLNQATTRLT